MEGKVEKPSHDVEQRAEAAGTASMPRKSGEAVSKFGVPPKRED
jgi:hypothetical protein